MHYAKKLIQKYAAFVLMSSSSLAMAADYSDFVTLPNGQNDDITLDSDGNLYISHTGGFNSSGALGTTVYKVTPDGTISTAVTGLSGPLGSEFDSNGNLYVTNFNNGVITKVTPDGTTSVFADLGNANSVNNVVINAQDELFVASYGSNSIVKLVDGQSPETWVSGSGINAPVGIAIDEAENIYVGSYDDGRVFKVDTSKNITELDSVPGGIGYLTYTNGNIYATARSSNEIYRVPTSGATATVLAGSSAAGFSFPNGIAPSHDGTKLYVSNYQNAKIIVIEDFENDSSEQTAPTAENDSVTVVQDSEIVIDVLSNDTSGGAVDIGSVNIVSAAQFGTTQIDESTGSITYTPFVDFVGDDSFVYTVDNEQGDTSNEATVSITVTEKAVAETSSGGGSLGISMFLMLLLVSAKSLFQMLKK
ncbi:Ig-like domain-containing protein [Pleionea sediminis]|uniref:Ig-like domain-containing protein n=1 Tax=Pleionea sediminis TaxID=2569479 RepID=UPI001185AE88|nr:Ig-like domain-containing protein [Pleionea sediminis]